ncbi:MAG: lipoprotein [Sulfurimonas sp.]|nr:lipoprotein [Sulfurimonas sp.]
MLIITVFLLSLSGCGYKAPPYYLEDAPVGDENVEFTVKKVDAENDKNVNIECVKEH